MAGSKAFADVVNPFSLPHLAEVVWPGAQARSLRPDESNSSSEDQTAYEGHHSHHSSHHSHEGLPGAHHSHDLHTPRKAQKLVREIQEAIALLNGGRGGVPFAPGLRSVGDLSFPSFDAADLTAGALHWEGSSKLFPIGLRMAGGCGGGGQPSPTLSQFLRTGSNSLGDRMGGSTPFLDEDFALVDSPGLLSGSAADAFNLSNNRLPSPGCEMPPYGTPHDLFRTPPPFTSMS
jgi:hypothetical protein